MIWIGFDKVWLAPGERRRIAITIDPSAANHPLGYWRDDTAADAGGWITPEGSYGLLVGRSATDIVLRDSITVRGVPRRFRTPAQYELKPPK